MILFERSILVREDELPPFPGQCSNCGVTLQAIEGLGQLAVAFYGCGLELRPAGLDNIRQRWRGECPK